MISMNNCDLCKAEKLTKWYRDARSWWAADCKTCGCPMVVARRHGRISDGDRAALVTELMAIADEEYGKQGYSIDFRQRKIKSHFHIHARPHG